MPDSKRPPGYELFFTPLEVTLNPTDFEMVRFAYIASKFGHVGQLRNDRSRYFDHPKAAAWIYISELGGRDPRVIINILLHDLPEGSYLLSSYRISINFDVDIALDVRGVTKLPKGKETTLEYLTRVVERGPWAILAKLCDRLHNLRTMSTFTPEEKNRQYEETQQYHLPILIPALQGYGGQWETYALLMKEKILATY